MDSKTTSVMMKMIMQPEDEYKKLIDENLDLKNKILKLYNDVSSSRETINIHELTIYELSNENNMLKNKLKTIEEYIQKQDVQIFELAKENKELKYEMAELKYEIIELRELMVELKDEIIELKVIDKSKLHSE